MASKNTAAGTAAGPMYIAATEQLLPPGKRIVDDPLAPSVLDGVTRLFFTMSKWAWLRCQMFKATERKGPGVWGGVLGRKRFIREAIDGAVADGIEALVVLGAGYDTNALRVATDFGLPAFELDQPENVTPKRSILEKTFSSLPEGLHLIPIDFETRDPGEVLAANGHDPNARTLFVWEGVTQYLTAPAIDKSLDFLSHAAMGSRLVFTYVPKDFIDGTNMYDAAPIYDHIVVRNRLWHFGVMPEDVEALVQPHGWHVLEDVGAGDYRQRYFAPAGRDLPIMKIERTVIAEKIG